MAEPLSVGILAEPKAWTAASGAGEAAEGAMNEGEASVEESEVYVHPESERPRPSFRLHIRSGDEEGGHMDCVRNANTHAVREDLPLKEQQTSSPSVAPSETHTSPSYPHADPPSPIDGTRGPPVRRRSVARDARGLLSASIQPVVAYSDSEACTSSSSSAARSSSRSVTSRGLGVYQGTAAMTPGDTTPLRWQDTPMPSDGEGGRADALPESRVAMLSDRTAAESPAMQGGRGALGAFQAVQEAPNCPECLYSPHVEVRVQSPPGQYRSEQITGYRT